MLKKKVSVSEKKNFGSDTNTEIQPWFRIPIPLPNFGCTLIYLHKIGALFDVM